MARRAVISTETILEAARELFLERGADVPTSEIARRAGVSEGSIFRRFPTKQKLFVAAIGLETDTALITAIDTLQTDDPRTALRRLATEMVGAFRTIMPRMMLLWSSREVDPHAVLGDECSPPKQMLNSVIAFFDRLMRSGNVRFAHPEITARAFMGALSHYVYFETMVGVGDLSAEG